MFLLSLLAIKLKYFYLTKSSTSQVTFLLDESLIEELTRWLTVNIGEIFLAEKPRKEKSTPGEFAFQGVMFTTGLRADTFALFAMSMRITVLFVMSKPIPVGIEDYCQNVKQVFLGNFEIRAWVGTYALLQCTFVFKIARWNHSSGKMRTSLAQGFF